MRRTEAVTAADARRLWEGGAAELDALAAAAAGRAGRRCWTRCWPRREAIWTAPHTRAARRCSGRRTPPTPAPRRRCARAARELRALAARPGAARRARTTLLRGARGVDGPRGDAAGRRACWSPTRRRSARAASARCSCAACRTASSRAARRPSRSSTTTPGPTLARASGLGAAAATRTCSAHERYLLLRVRVAPGGGAVPLLPLLRRGGRPGAALAVPGRRPGAVHRRAVGRSAARGCWPRSPGRPPPRRRRTSCAARTPPREREPEPGPLAPPRPQAVLRGARRARAGGGARAGDVRRVRRALARGGAAEAGRGSSPTRSRCGAARSPTRCSSGRCARLRERTGSARLVPGDAGRRAGRAAASALRELRGRELAGARARAALRALEEDLVRYLRHEAECGAGLEPSGSSGASAARATSTGAGAQRLGPRGDGARGPDRRRRRRRRAWCATTRASA